MKLSELAIKRPVATTLLTIGVALAGAAAFFLLPVAPVPNVDQPTISVSASMPGASPETMASTVATPLERHLGQIADVTEMTSYSSVGNASITLQFGISRDIDGAARDVQAAINAARVDLPASLRSNPTYRKYNPADSPIMILGMTSETLTQGQLYDSAATVLQQQLSQVDGVGLVNIGGSSLPAVRVELNPGAMFKYGIGLEDVRAALASANANSPKGAIESAGLHFQIYANDQARKAVQYRDLIVAFRNNAAVRVKDVAQVNDSVEDLRNLGMFDGKPSVLLIIYRQPGANIIATVDRIYALLPRLRSSIPPAITVNVAMDRTTTIRAALHDVERNLLTAMALVVIVVFFFLRDARATFIPAVAVPVSLLGTFGAMLLCGYSLDNLSLMALTIATGFVVDDAIVVMENIHRHVEDGMPRMRAALLGAREVGFTVLSMSLSLIAVFTPILMMGGIVGLMLREFAMTLSVAIMISLAISLTTTPMMCGRLITKIPESSRSWLFRTSERWFLIGRGMYQETLRLAVSHPRLTMLTLFLTVALNLYLYMIVPTGLFPQQDTGRLNGNIIADQAISFQLMRQKLETFISVIRKDPAVEHIAGFTGGRSTNSGFVFISLKPLAERHMTSDEVVSRLRKSLTIPGATCYLQVSQDIRTGGRSSNSQYQYTLQADDLTELSTWAKRLTAALTDKPGLEDVNSDQQEKGLETDLKFDRDTASRLQLNASQIDNSLYDAFGQRQVSTIYNALNQYHVVMEVEPRYWQSPETLNDIYISTSGGAVGGTQSTNAVAGTVIIGNGTGLRTATATTTAPTASSVANDAARNLAQNSLANTTHSGASTGAAVSTAAETMVPMATFSHFGPGHVPLSVNHQGHFASATLSFNLPVGSSLSDAVTIIEDTMREIHVPNTVHGSFQGTARTYQQSQGDLPLFIAAALLAVYIVLGMLYESYIHPLTILSTLPSAGVGALLALILSGTEFSTIALIGVFLLIGLVKKNAIMMIDVAIDLERKFNLTPQEAIQRACMLRFRPIMMTTMVAVFGALPLAIGQGNGGELRRPLGITIVGGLAVSQLLTLYTTPVVYLYLDRLTTWWRRRHAGPRPRPGPADQDQGQPNPEVADPVGAPA